MGGPGSGRRKGGASVVGGGNSKKNSYNRLRRAFIKGLSAKGKRRKYIPKGVELPPGHRERKGKKRYAR
jgi:hypothetical protein